MKLSLATLVLCSTSVGGFGVAPFAKRRSTPFAKSTMCASAQGNEALDLIKAAQGNTVTAPPPPTLSETPDPSRFIFDDAARLAYSRWCRIYEREEDEERFKVFMENYLKATIENVKAKDKVISLGSDADGSKGSPGDDPPAAKKELSSPLDAAMKAASQQQSASSAIADAFDELDQEELALANKLGLDSVEELENFIDSQMGIAEDGGEIDIAVNKEASARAEYADWCAKYDREQSEDRFKTFWENLKKLEELEVEEGKAVQLNEWADRTEEEVRHSEAANRRDEMSYL